MEKILHSPHVSVETPWAHQHLLLLYRYWDTKTSRKMILSCLFTLIIPLSVFYFTHIGNIRENNRTCELRMD